MAVYYITYGEYTGLEDYHLKASPAAVQKGNYIIEKLECMKELFEVISLSGTSDKRFKVYPSKIVPCGEYGKYIVWTTFGKPNGVFRRLHSYYRREQLKHFLNTLNKEDVVIAYHSLFSAKTLYNAKQKRKFKLILELEEIYQDVVQCSKTESMWEKKIISLADAYILATEALAQQIRKNSPYIVANGTYQIERQRHCIFDDHKIHCVYAGTFDPIKGGAAAAAAAAEFLSNQYHVHILGFGTQEQTQKLIKEIERINSITECTLTFEGLKKGEEYIQFIQKCHIGLCTQIPDAKYTETSFPSKILVYLANGLRVLSVDISAVEESEVGDLLYYYKEQTPKAIAEAIEKIDVTKQYDSRARLVKLDRKFEKDLKDLIAEVENEIN